MGNWSSNTSQELPDSVLYIGTIGGRGTLRHESLDVEGVTASRSSENTRPFTTFGKTRAQHQWHPVLPVELDPTSEHEKIIRMSRVGKRVFSTFMLA